jgi:hypothetical protein
MIYEKNRAFDALVKIERRIARRQHRAAVPKEWLARRDQLQAEYDRAKWAASLYRFFRLEESMA